MTTQEIINDMRSHTVTSMRAAADRLEELQQELTEAIRERYKTVADLIKQRDEALANNQFSQQVAAIRQEPSRLEIAAMLKAGWFANREGDFHCTSEKWWLEQADKLIAAAREAK